MKNTFLALVVLAIAAIGGNAFAQASATASADAKAKIICPITITMNDYLEFATIANGTLPTTLTVNSNGVAPTQGGAGQAQWVGASPYGTHRAMFTGCYDGNYGPGVTFSNAIVTNFPGANAPVLANLNSTIGTTTGTGCSTCTVYYVGGDIQLVATTATGSYTGSISATIAYN